MKPIVIYLWTLHVPSRLISLGEYSCKVIARVVLDRFCLGNWMFSQIEQGKQSKLEQVSRVLSLPLVFLEGQILLAIRKSSDTLQSEVKGQSLPPNLIQAKVIDFASIVYKFFWKVFSSVIKVLFRVVLCMAYLDTPELPHGCSKAGRSLTQTKRFCDIFFLLQVQLSNFTLWETKTNKQKAAPGHRADRDLKNLYILCIALAHGQILSLWSVPDRYFSNLSFSVTLQLKYPSSAGNDRIFLNV